MKQKYSIGIASIITGFVMLAAAFLIGVAIFSSLSGAGFLFSLGDFLFGSFSWLSLFLVLYLFALAFIAFMPGFRSDLLFFLTGSLLPFCSMAILIAFWRDQELFYEKWPNIARLGSGLFSLVIILFAALSVLITVFLKSMVFSKRESRPAEAGGDIQQESSLGDTVLDDTCIEEIDFDQNLYDEEDDEEDDSDDEDYFDEETVSVFSVPNLPPAPVLKSLDTPTISEDLDDYEDEYEDNEDDELEFVDDYSDLELDVGEDSAETVAVPELDTEPDLKPIQVLFHNKQEDEDRVETGKSKETQIPGKKKKLEYSIPSDGILTQYPDGQYWIVDEKTRQNGEVLKETLKEFKIEAELTGIRKGPVITMYEILPAPGVRLAKIANLSDNIALRLAASSVRIVAPIPGKHAVGIEVPNARRSIVSFREIVEHDAFKNSKMEIPVVLGKDISGEPKIADLTQTPHLLIAGATGAGKSVCVNSIIASILFKRSFNEVKLILIDPKIVELKLYNGIPHLLTPVITESKKAFQALQYCICEMERRYSLLDGMGVRDIRSFNRKIKEKKMATENLPYIVVVIDEFADLMATTGKELESTLARLAAMSRAVGIHLVLATQRPSIDVITGLIKANIPSRIAFMVASKFDSRIIIDMVGAEKLLGKGDMLYSGATDAFPVRMQGSFISDEEVEQLVEYVKTFGEPDYIDDEIFIDDEDDGGPSLFDMEDDEPLFEKALEIVLAQGKASASFLQRRLKIGYNRAARIVEMMEDKGIVGGAQGSKPRDVLRNPEVFSNRQSDE